MSFYAFLFYALSTLLIGAALSVISAKNPVKAVLSLIVAFFATSFLWVMLQAEFLALTLIIVYVGAVMVLFIFVVMMLDIRVASVKAGFSRALPLGLLFGILIMGQLWFVFKSPNSGFSDFSQLSAVGADYSNIKVLGKTLFTEHLLPFEIAGVLLLVAIVAAIGCVFRGPRVRRQQSVSEQVKVRKAQRLHLVDLPRGKSS